MKLIRKTSLIRRQKDTVVHCEIELCEFAGAPDRYLVNLRQGRTGEEWRESTRTPQPVDLPSAETLFALAVVERMAQGFVDPAAPVSPQASAAPSANQEPRPAAPTAPQPTDADRILLARLEQRSWKSLKQPQRNRTIWRIGERRLRAAVPELVELIQRGDAMQDYCIAWAIGRCGDRGAAQAMQELHVRGSTDAVRRIALQAWLMLSDEAARRERATALIAAWPEALRSAWAAEDETAIVNMAASETGWRDLPFATWLEQLDQIALDAPMGRRILLALLRIVSMRVGAFRAVRHIYKAAEMRADGDIFGLLQRRFETTQHAAGDYVWVQGRYRSFAEEGARADSTVAYGIRTRTYLLLRGWRTLRRLGMDRDPDFVPMALGALSALDDRDAGNDRRALDRYGHWHLFNRLLRAQGGWRHSRSGRRWYRVGPAAADSSRTEAFPEIWDEHPDALLWLMQNSRAEGVHAFAARALSDNAAYCAAMSQDTLRGLLRSPYLPSARFAFQVARQRFEPGVPDADWLMLLVQSTLPEANQYALDCISRDPVRYAADTLLVATILCSPVEAVRLHGRLLCQSALTLAGQPAAIALQLLDWLDHCGDIDDAEALVPAIASDLTWIIDNPLRAAAADAPYNRVLALTAHRLAAVRILACHWLLLHSAPPSALPASTLATLLRDPDVNVRGMGVRLFGALPDHLLSAQIDLIASFATHPDAAIRRGIDAVIERLAANDPAFAASILPVLLDALFRGETGDGLHTDLLAWIDGPLRLAPELNDPHLLQRLLAARSKGAQRLGAALIGRVQPAQFDVADWASFGRNQNANVRQWAYAAFSAHPEQARAQMEAALRLFDSKFDDTREFATQFFSTAFTREDWTPLLLVNLCDHLDPAAQRFGRAMITTHFDVADITEYMLKLSQHPSANMQLFVSAWLESASGGNVERLRRLEPYFLSVLSQVNRGRVVKTRVQAFLREQAALSEDIAAFVAQVFARQVVTVAIADKAQYIEGLRAIQERYPRLPAVMTIHAPPVLSTARGTP